MLVQAWLYFSEEITKKQSQVKAGFLSAVAKNPLNKLSMVARASYLGTQQVEAGRLEIKARRDIVMNWRPAWTKCDPALNKKTTVQLTEKKKKKFCRENKANGNYLKHKIVYV